MADSLSHHPFGIRYLLLWLGTSLIRLPAAIAMYYQVNKGFRTLRPDVSRIRIKIPSREKGRSITVDVYEKIDQSKTTNRYAHINFHGSGFVIPSLGTDIEFCAQLASTGTVVFDADYRKAPEHPFPAAYQDGQDVLSYLEAQSSDFDTHHITSSGFSAGANIAMAMAVTNPSNPLAGVVSLYGNADLTKVYPAPDPTTYDSGGILPGWLRSFFYACLVLPGQDKADPRLSPVYAPLNRWPKHAFFACGTADCLHDSTKVVAARLKQAGHADVDFMSVDREAHAFDKVPKEGSPTQKRRDEMYQRAIEMVKRAQKDVIV